jgi:sterol desaturase/sphingolipid hydroxylase (fatty acid hydroxylase superfamily)
MSFFDNPALTQDPTVYAIPLFIALIALEVFIDIKRKLNIYELKDSAACISMGLGVVVIGIVTKSFAYLLYSLIYEFRIFDMPNTWWMWVLLLFADDFSFYWHHRLSHSIRFLWAAHVQHHSSVRMNLSVALRQSWGEPFYKYLFYLWLPLMGFHPLWILVMQAISLVYQFFQHTELVGKLGPVEWLMNTPSHHRVHHATQVKYLDKNHAGIFIIWDKLFGTFEEEHEKPVYGITSNINTHNPLKIATHEYAALWNDIKRTPRIIDKLKYIFMPPGWSHDGEDLTSQNLQRKARLGHSTNN